MVPILIVVGLVALGVGIVAFATRRPTVQAAPPHADQDTVWTDAVDAAQAHPFAHAPELDDAPPVSTSLETPPQRISEPRP